MALPDYQVDVVSSGALPDFRVAVVAQGATPAPDFYMTANVGPRLPDLRVAIVAANAVPAPDFRVWGLELAPTNSVAPVISGTPTVGQTLSATTGTWTGSPTAYAYQWKRGGVNISGATAATYLLVTADLAANITCAVTASNTGGSATATSNSLGPVAAAAAATFNPANISADLVLSNGNLTATRTGSASATAGGKGTAPKTTGSWHVEFAITSIVGGVNVGIGVALVSYSNTITLSSAGSGGVVSTGAVTVDGVAQTASDTFTTGDIIAVEYDATAGSLWLQKLGGTGRKGPFSLPSGAGIVPATTISGGATGVGSVININAGQSAFAITPTGGFSAWA